jgi:hypothetical protein
MWGVSESFQIISTRSCTLPFQLRYKETCNSKTGSQVSPQTSKHCTEKSPGHCLLLYAKVSPMPHRWRGAATQHPRPPQQPGAPHPGVKPRLDETQQRTQTARGQLPADRRAAAEPRCLVEPPVRPIRQGHRGGQRQSKARKSTKQT